MTKAELLMALAGCAVNNDPEEAHSLADDFLLDYIDDEDVRAAYHEVEKWYA